MKVQRAEQRRMRASEAIGSPEQKTLEVFDITKELSPEDWNDVVTEFAQDVLARKYGQACELADYLSILHPEMLRELRGELTPAQQNEMRQQVQNLREDYYINYQADSSGFPNIAPEPSSFLSLLQIYTGYNALFPEDRLRLEEKDIQHFEELVSERDVRFEYLADMFYLRRLGVDTSFYNPDPEKTKDVGEIELVSFAFLFLLDGQARAELERHEWWEEFREVVERGYQQSYDEQQWKKLLGDAMLRTFFTAERATINEDGTVGVRQPDVLTSGPSLPERNAIA